jgi:hypothetical protein
MAHAARSRNPLAPALEALVEELARLTSKERQTIVRAVEERVAARSSLASRPLSVDVLLASSGIVSLGGDAVEDARALYDG